MSHKLNMSPISTAEHKPGPFERVLVTQGSQHTIAIAYWHPDFDNGNKPKWCYNGYAGHVIPEWFHPTHYTPFDLEMNPPLTAEWQVYNGVQQNVCQDIMLEDGSVVKGCWPNAGRWKVIAKKADNAPCYFGASFPHLEAKKVRLTHLQPL